jgi:hypothetical protein
MAQALPIYNIEQNCRSYGQECIDGEVTSRVKLQESVWAASPTALRQRCITWEAAWYAKYAPERAAMIRYTTLELCALGEWEKIGYPK